MKVILTRDVAKLGRRYEVVNVPDGYGLNKLIPQGMAKPATPENLKQIKAQADKNQADKEVSAAEFETVKNQLSGKVVDVKVEANEDGKMYQALKPQAVIEAIKSELEVSILESQLVIKDPIKTTGEHNLEISNGDASASFIINVIS